MTVLKNSKPLDGGGGGSNALVDVVGSSKKPYCILLWMGKRGVHGQRATLIAVLVSAFAVAGIEATIPQPFGFPGETSGYASIGRYPARWWTPVIDPQKPDWEILPQAAKPGEVILSKRNELGILSNFAATPFTLRGVRYASVEGFWQMMLYPEGWDDPRAKATFLKWPYTRAEVALMTAFQAKAAGDIAEENMRKLGIDWVTFEGRRMRYRSMVRADHYRLIVEAMRAKLSQNPSVRQILLSTGDLVLLPDHTQEPNAPPEWAYFKIWMEIRRELQHGGSAAKSGVN
jgi:predicted NAD-dependent protein-ADP-ribosyltransferase YbiA (DUF1768 family)